MNTDNDIVVSKQHTISSNDIAIIGMSCRLPAANDINAFWHNLFHGIDCGKDVTAQDLIAAQLPLSLLTDPNYVKRSYCLDNPTDFDADFFNCLPKEAALMDPQHRVLLECAYHALQHAGYAPHTYEGIISCIGGIARNTYFTSNIATNPDLLANANDYQLSIASEKDFSITRVAYKLNLKGAAINVQTACSTSGTAIYMAIQSLLAGDCDIALICGGRIEIPHHVGYFYTEGAPLSPDAFCRAFDSNANGMVRGSGMLCLVLKRQDLALADADTIYATIKSIGISNDGNAKIGFTAPSVQGQTTAMLKAQQKAGISALDISYIEAHGTGTFLGDPIEIAALQAAFAQNGANTAHKHCAIGSVKTNIGHLDAGAGLAGIIKTALSLHYKLLPPSLHFEQANTQIPFHKTPFYVQTKLTRWQRTANKPLIAGVNSLGLGGTNVHIIMQEAPTPIIRPITRQYKLLLLSAKTKTALSTSIRTLCAYLNTNKEARISDMAYTLQVGRNHYPYRSYILLADPAFDLNNSPIHAVIYGNNMPIYKALSIIAKPSDINETHFVSTTQQVLQQSAHRVGIAFMFAGGGAQYLNMAADLYAEEPVFRENIDLCAAILSHHCGMTTDIRNIIYPNFNQANNKVDNADNNGNEANNKVDNADNNGNKANNKVDNADNNGNQASNDIAQPSLALPCLFAVEYSLVQLWLSWGIKPDVMIGHSAGEYVAACISGVFSLNDALQLIYLRGKLFDSLPDGAMLSVALDSDTLIAQFGAYFNGSSPHSSDISLSIAAINQSNHCVVSGNVALLAQLSEQLLASGIESKPIPISVAAHSAMVEPILGTFELFLKTLTLHAPQVPFISNLNGQFIQASEAQSVNYWVNHLRNTVYFGKGLDLLLQSGYDLLEVSPSQTLTAYARRNPNRKAEQSIFSSMRHAKESIADTHFIYQTLAKLWQLGYPVNWNNFNRVEPLHRIALPTYPFERKPFYIQALPLNHATPTLSDNISSLNADLSTNKVDKTNYSANKEADNHADEPINCNKEADNHADEPINCNKEADNYADEPINRNKEADNHADEPINRNKEADNHADVSNKIMITNKNLSNEPTNNNLAMLSNNRNKRIATELQYIFHQLSGMPVDLMDNQATFLELGFDSLFMTQAVAAINKKLGVKLQFRQLFEDATNISELAALLNKQIAPHLFADTPLSDRDASIPIVHATDKVQEVLHTKQQTPLNDASVSISDKETKHHVVADNTLVQPINHTLVNALDNAIHANLPLLNADQNVAASDNNALSAILLQQLAIIQQQLALLSGNTLPNKDNKLVANDNDLANNNPKLSKNEDISALNQSISTHNLLILPSNRNEQTLSYEQALHNHEQAVHNHQQALHNHEQAVLNHALATHLDNSSSHISPTADKSAIDAHLDASITNLLEQAIKQANGYITPNIDNHAHGPWKPIDKKKAVINDHQLAHLSALIARYTARTKGSKSLAAKQRVHLADARSITGFHKLWKEMTYQIAASHSAGALLYDVDNNAYIDFVMGFGINLFGHNPDFVQAAILEQLPKGLHLGVLTPLAHDVAELICDITGMERAVFVNTGSEGVSAAIRAARTATCKPRVAVFDGDYHGIADELLVKGVTINGITQARPVSPGIPSFLVENVLVLDYNDPNVLTIIRDNAADLAAIVVEPLTAQAPHIQRFELLKQLRAICTECDIAFIFDELITGFRLHPRGAQGWFGIEADICSYGKIICGGLPMAAVAGKSRFLDVFDGGAWQFGDDSFPSVGVTFFGGTFARHPLSLATAKATLLKIKSEGIALYNDLHARSAAFALQIRQLFEQYQAPLAVYSTASMLCIKVTDNNLLSRLFFFLMREKGVHITERGGFISTAHSRTELEHVLIIIEQCLAEMQDAQFYTPSPTSADYGSIVLPPYSDIQNAIANYDFYPHNNVITIAPPFTDTQAKSDMFNETPDYSHPNPSTSSIITHQMTPNSFIPLTESQQEVWLGNQMEAQSAAGYNLSSAFCFDGDLNMAILQQTFEQLIARHAALRTSFSPEGTHQIVAAHIDIALPLTDLSYLYDSDKDLPIFDWSNNSDIAAEQWAFNEQQVEALKSIQSKEVATLFNLAEAPLLRVQVIRLRPDRHILLLTVHHIVADGWSVGILVSELSKIYTALVKGEAHGLAQPKQLDAYALEKSKQKNSAEVIASEDYWLQKISGDLPVLELPSDRPRPPIKTYDAAFEKVIFSAADFVPLQQIAAKQGATTFAMLLAAFKAYLYRISAQQEFIVGVIAAGQSTSGNQDLVGHCVNLLPLRTEIDADATFDKLLKKTRSEIFDLFQYQYCTFNTLLKKLKHRRDAGHQPVISVVFNMDAAAEALHFEGLSTQITAVPRKFETYDIFFNVKQIGNSLSLEWIFNTDLFDRQTAQRHLQEFATLLRGISNNVQEKIALLPILPSAQQQLILHDWTNNAVQVPTVTNKQLHTIHFLIEQQVARSPQRIAAACLDNTLSYDALNRRANQLAHYLIAKGVTCNVRVGILIDRSLDMLVATLAVLKAGGTYVPLEGQNNPIERLSLIAEDAAIQFLLTHQNPTVVKPEMVMPETLRYQENVIYIDRLAEQIATQADHNPNIVVPLDSIAYIIYTSGSTAKPKGVVITHASAVDFLHCFGIYPGLYETDTIFAVASLSFDPSVQDLFLPLMKGGKVYIATHEIIMNGQLFKQALKDSGATLIQATPATWNMLLSVGWEGDKNLRVMSGGEGLTRELAQKLAGKTAELWNIYGPTETTVWTTARKITESDFLGMADFALKIGYLPVGRPIPNTFVYILDNHLQAMPIGVPGEICIGGPGVMVGYLNRPDLNDEVLIANPFTRPEAPVLYKTGDIGCWLPNGDIEYMNRADNQVKIRGYRIELGEIESAISQYAEVHQNVVIVRPDATGQRRLIAYIITHNNKAINWTNLRLFLKVKLPEYMIPAAFVQMEQFPLTATLKVNRRALPEPDSNIAPQTEIQYEAPQSHHEKILANMWQELLHLPQIGINDNFFELGGHSLIAVTMMALITKETGKTLPLATLLEYPTIKKLAGLLDGNAAAKWDSLVPVKASGSKTPIYIVHGAGLHVLLFNTLANLMSAEQPVYALQAHGLNGIDRPFDSIEAIASHYISEIVQHNPNGPYALAGYSFGGTIAFEMAKQLTAAGRKVSLVGLFDTVAPVNEPENSLDRMWLLGKKVGAALSAIAKDPIPTLQYRAHTLQRSLNHFKWKIGTTTNPVIDAEEANHLVDEMNSRAYDKYQLKPYSGKIHLFRAESRRYYVADTEYLGWLPFVQGGIEIINTKGDHHTLFSPPHNIAFAQALQDCLDKVHS